MESAAASEASDAGRLCEGGCGFFGSPQLIFFCSVCFKKTHGEEEFKRRTLQAEKKDHPSPATQSAAAATPPASLSTVEGASPGGSEEQAQSAKADGAEGKEEAKTAAANSEQPAAHASAGGGGGDKEESVEPASKKMAPSRCMSCKKKVGLLGFHCRCGGTYCEKHRYSDKHECTYDYKTHGRDQLAKDNPACAADKMDKI